MNDNNEFMKMWNNIVGDANNDTFNASHNNGHEDIEINDEEDVSSLSDKLIQTEKAYDDIKTKYLYQTAEYDNYRRRTLKEKEELLLNGHQKVIEHMLPILDDFERAMENMINEEDKNGISLIYNKFKYTLQGLGVELINIENNVTTFDANKHEAILMVNVNDKEQDNKIIDCTQRGYYLNGKIIRHSKVVVGTFTE